MNKILMSKRERQRMQDETRVFGMSLEKLNRYVRAAEERARLPLIDKIEELYKERDKYIIELTDARRKLTKADALAEAVTEIYLGLHGEELHRTGKPLRIALAAYREERDG